MPKVRAVVEDEPKPFILPAAIEIIERMLMGSESAFEDAHEIVYRYHEEYGIPYEER